MRIGWIGFHSEGVLALEAAARAGSQIVGVVTLRPESAAKRSAAVDYGSVCADLGIPVHYVKNINDADAVEHLHKMSMDVGVVLGWSQILRTAALSCAKYGMVGAHASKLPHNRGSAPVNWAIIRGEAEAGNSLMWLSEGVDEGHLIAQRSFAISKYDTCASIYQKVAESNRDMILELMENLAKGKRPSTPQPETNEPILPRRRPADGEIDWQLPAEEIYDFVRALTVPYPGAFTWLNGRKLTLWEVALLPALNEQKDGRPSVASGTILGPAFSPNESACGQVIACRGGNLLLLCGELEQAAQGGSLLRGQALSEKAWQGITLASTATTKQAPPSKERKNAA